MKFKILVIILLLLSLSPVISCSSPPGNTNFPPPEGYSSWEEYQNRTTTTPITTQQIMTATAPTVTVTIPPITVTITTTASSSTTPFEPITITGSGDMTSAPFSITSKQWIVDWSCIPKDSRGMVFGFVIRRQGSSANVESTDTSNSELQSGIIISHAGPGVYYIILIAFNIENWNITISPLGE